MKSDERPGRDAQLGGEDGFRPGRDVHLGGKRDWRLPAMTWEEYVIRARQLAGIYGQADCQGESSYWRAAAGGTRQWPKEHLRRRIGIPIIIHELVEAEERAAALVAEGMKVGS
jgi:hypothetical protein